MTKREINNTILNVLNACSNKYKDADILVDYTTYMVHKLTSILDTPVVNGDMTFNEAKAMLLPFLQMKYASLGYSPDGNVWEELACYGDATMFGAFVKLRAVCKK